MDLTSGRAKQTSNAGETAPPAHWTVDDRLSYGGAAFPKECDMEDHICEVNSVPLSVDMCNGTPYHEMHCNTNAWVHTLVKLSTTVKR